MFVSGLGRSLQALGGGLLPGGGRAGSGPVRPARTTGAEPVAGAGRAAPPQGRGYVDRGVDGGGAATGRGAWDPGPRCLEPRGRRAARPASSPAGTRPAIGVAGGATRGGTPHPPP